MSLQRIVLFLSSNHSWLPSVEAIESPIYRLRSSNFIHTTTSFLKSLPIIEPLPLRSVFGVLKTNDNE